MLLRATRATHSLGALFALGVLLSVVALACVAIGSVPTSFAQVASLVLQAMGAAPKTLTTAEQQSVVFAIRLPRICLGILVGAGLGISGASMQGVFRNPLVDPGLLGVSSGAALFAVATIVLGSHVTHWASGAVLPYVLPIAAFLGGLTAMAAVQALSRAEGHTRVATLLLAGIAINALTGALTGLLTFMANDAQLRSITFWSLGSLGGATWKTVLVALPFLGVPVLLLARMSRNLNLLLLGEREALHLGANVEVTKRCILALVALAVGTSVATSGVVGFVGLVVPHLLRLAMGPDHRFLLPASALLGAMLLLGSDAIARTLVAPAELPLGIVTASLGTPFFLLLLVRDRKRIA